MNTNSGWCKARSLYRKRIYNQLLEQFLKALMVYKSCKYRFFELFHPILWEEGVRGNKLLEGQAFLTQQYNYIKHYWLTEMSMILMGDDINFDYALSA